MRGRAKEVRELAIKPAPPPSFNFSWETSSAVSEATTENLASGLKELEAQQAKVTDATTKLCLRQDEDRGATVLDSQKTYCPNGWGYKKTGGTV